MKNCKAKSSTKVPLNFLTTVYENGYNGINESRAYTIDFETKRHLTIKYCNF